MQQTAWITHTLWSEEDEETRRRRLVNVPGTLVLLIWSILTAPLFYVHENFITLYSDPSTSTAMFVATCFAAVFFFVVNIKQFDEFQFQEFDTQTEHRLRLALRFVGVLSSSLLLFSLILIKNVYTMQITIGVLVICFWIDAVEVGVNDLLARTATTAQDANALHRNDGHSNVADLHLD